MLHVLVCFSRKICDLWRSGSGGCRANCWERWPTHHQSYSCNSTLPACHPTAFVKILIKKKILFFIIQKYFSSCTEILFFIQKYFFSLQIMMQLILVLILIFLKQNIFLQMFQYFLLTISLSGVWMKRQLCKNIILMCQSWRLSIMHRG